MIGVRRLFILVLSLLAFLGVVSIVVGILLGAGPFQVGRTLIQEAADRWHTVLPAVSDYMHTAVGPLLHGGA